MLNNINDEIFKYFKLTRKILNYQWIIKNIEEMNISKWNGRHSIEKFWNKTKAEHKRKSMALNVYNWKRKRYIINYLRSQNKYDIENNQNKYLPKWWWRNKKRTKI